MRIVPSCATKQKATPRDGGGTPPIGEYSRELQPLHSARAADSQKGWELVDVSGQVFSKKTVRYRFPIPRLDYLLNPFWSKIDLWSASDPHLTRKWKTSFKTKDGIYD